jgi:hypothetical protein
MMLSSFKSMREGYKPNLSAEYISDNDARAKDIKQAREETSDRSQSTWLYVDR